MLKNFFKYQSLGNDFILFDCYKKPETYVNQAIAEQNFSQAVRTLCNRHFGVGADGVLVLKGNTGSRFPEMLVFNADGSKAEICLNGLRCVAYHLNSNYNFPNQFKIKVGDKIIDCFVLPGNEPNEAVLIKTNIGIVNYLGEQSITTSQGNIAGHVVSVGNPHFVVFQKISIEWLAAHGAEIEKNEAFPNKTNAEFVWEESPNVYKSLVYERGCGITLACSSGAAAIVGTLGNLGKIEQGQDFNIDMPGGNISCCINPLGEVILIAEAKLVFSGIC